MLGNYFQCLKCVVTVDQGQNNITMAYGYYYIYYRRITDSYLASDAIIWLHSVLTCENSGTTNHSLCVMGHYVWWVIMCNGSLYVMARYVWWFIMCDGSLCVVYYVWWLIMCDGLLCVMVHYVWWFIICDSYVICNGVAV